MGLFDGKTALIVGVANKSSIAWGIAEALREEGARLGFSYAPGDLERRVRPLAESVGAELIEECDVDDDAAIDRLFEKAEQVFGSLDVLVHAIAFAERQDLVGRFVDTSREGFAHALDVSAYSLVALARRAAPLMPRRRRDPHPDRVRQRRGAAQLQRHGRRQGRARGLRALSRRRPRRRRHPRQRPVAGGRQDPGRDRRAGLPQAYRHIEKVTPLRTMVTQADVGRTARLAVLGLGAGSDRRDRLRGRRLPHPRLDAAAGRRPATAPAGCPRSVWLGCRARQLLPDLALEHLADGVARQALDDDQLPGQLVGGDVLLLQEVRRGRRA